MATAAAKKIRQEKKHTFTYQGTDRRGAKTQGEFMAVSPAMARAELRRQGITVSRLRRKSELTLFGGKAIKPLDIAIFTRQMATMMRAGVPLIQSFEIVAEGLDKPAMKELVLKLKVDIEGGSSFASALREHPKYFDDLFCSLVEAGETSGALETMLDRLALYKEKTEALKAKIKKAVKYPITVLIVAAIVTAILLIKVVPTFQELFEGFGAELPAMTQMVIRISEWMQSKGFYLLLGIIALVMAFSMARRRSQAFSDKVDAVALKLPVMGDIIFKSTVARFSRTLSTTFSAGVPLIEALEACAGATGNAVYRNAVLRIRDDVSTGQQLQFAMRSTGIFPAMAIQMTAIGEESGALDDMLGKVAEHYENEVDNAVDGLTSMLEPLIMSFLGIVVGGLIIAMYLPIFQLGNVV